MPRYFLRLKHSSFLRQLNSFGFRRIHKQRTKEMAFQHPQFRKGKPELALQIQKSPSNTRRQNTLEKASQPMGQAPTTQKSVVTPPMLSRDSSSASAQQRLAMLSQKETNLTLCNVMFGANSSGHQPNQQTYTIGGDVSLPSFNWDTPIPVTPPVDEREEMEAPSPRVSLFPTIFSGYNEYMRVEQREPMCSSSRWPPSTGQPPMTASSSGFATEQRQVSKLSEAQQTLQEIFGGAAEMFDLEPLHIFPE